MLQRCNLPFIKKHYLPMFSATIPMSFIFEGQSLSCFLLYLSTIANNSEAAFVDYKMKKITIFKGKYRVCENITKVMAKVKERNYIYKFHINAWVSGHPDVELDRIRFFAYLEMP